MKFFLNWIFWALVSASALLGTGCANIPRSANYARNTADGPAMAIGQSTLPANPVRNSSSYSRSMSGDWEKYHSQGSSVDAYRTFDCCGQPQTTVTVQSYQNSFERKITPPPRNFNNQGTVDDPRYIVPNSTVVWPAPKGSRK
jgi:hypothetical protein